MSEAIPAALTLSGDPRTLVEVADAVLDYVLERGNGACPGMVDGIHVVEDFIRKVVYAVMPSTAWEELSLDLHPGAIDEVHVLESDGSDVVVAVMPMAVWEELLSKAWPGRDVEWPNCDVYGRAVSHREAAVIMSNA